MIVCELNLWRCKTSEGIGTCVLSTCRTIWLCANVPVFSPSIVEQTIKAKSVQMIMKSKTSRKHFCQNGNVDQRCPVSCCNTKSKVSCFLLKLQKQKANNGTYSILGFANSAPGGIRICRQVIALVLHVHASALRKHSSKGPMLYVYFRC